MGKRTKTSQSKKQEFQRKYDSIPDRKVKRGDAPRPWYDGLSVASAVGVALFVVYIRTLHPSVPGGDSGELIVTAHELGVAHPPGYPLFTLLAKLSMLVVPVGNPAWKVNLLNGFLSAVSGAIIQITVMRLTGSLASSLLSAALFNLSQLTWTWSVTAEVFGLNNLFIALLMYLTVLFEETDCPNIKIRVAYVGSFVSGLSLCNQHTSVIYIAVIAIRVIRSLSSTWVLTLKNLLRIGMYFGLGLLPYVYLPVSAYLNRARWTWGDQTTLLGFLTHLLRSEYGTFDLGKEQEGQGFLFGLSSYFTHLLKDLIIIGPALCIPGLIGSVRMWSINKAPGIFVIMFTLYACFFSWRANLDMQNPLFKGVVERFWMQSDIVAAVLAGFGLHVLMKFITKSQTSNDSTFGKYFSLFLAAAVTVVQARNFTVCDQSGNYLVRDFALSLLNTIPKNAILLTKGDLPTNSMRYLHLCENIRSDLDVLDQEILSYKWSLPMMRKFYPNLKFPGDQWFLRDAMLSDGTKAFNFNTFLNANSKRKIFVCIGVQERDDSWKTDFQLWPYGVCHQIVPKTKPFDPTKWAEKTGFLAENWSYPSTGYPVTSWEKVANDEMWHAKISTAFFLYQQGTTITDTQTKQPFLVKAYELYKRALNKHKGKDYPPFWHKNFGLAAEKLLHLEGHAYKNLELCKESIDQFQLYLQLQDDDADRDSMTAAVETLKQRFNMYKQLEQVAETTENIIKRATP